MGYVLWDVVGCVVGVDGRVRGVDCVCATEPPCSSVNGVGNAGAAALAAALEKGADVTTLHARVPGKPVELTGLDCGKQSINAYTKPLPVTSPLVASAASGRRGR